MHRRSMVFFTLVALIAAPLAILAVSSAPTSISSAGSTYYVSYLGNNALGNGTEASPWRTIGYAVSVVNPGDIIRLADDNNDATDDYVENVVIDKPVQILSYDQVGPNPQVRAASSLAPVFRIDHADGVTIKNLDIYGANQEADMMTPGYTQRAGVYVSYCTGSVIEDCRIGWDSNHTNLHGIYMVGCDDCTIRRNLISCSLKTGIYLADTYNSAVMQNACDSNHEYGIALQIMSARITIMNNSFNANRDDGMFIAGNSGNTIVGNSVSNNGGYGINMMMTAGHILYLNSLSDNGLGNAIDSEGRSSWSSPQEIQYVYGSQKHTGIVGNYWSDYTGSDNGAGGRIAGDGIGDTDLPYFATHGVSDAYPLMSILGVKADFTASNAAGLAPLEVQFTDRSVGDVLTWAWDLDGDAITDSTIQNPTITYQDPGVYTVTLTVTSSSGTDTRTKRACVLAVDAVAWATVGTENATTVQSQDGTIILQFPAGAAGRAFTLVITELNEDDVWPAQSGYRFGDTFFSIEGTDQLDKEVTICARYSDADLEAAGGEPDKLALSYFDWSTGEWTLVETTIDSANQTLTASADHFSWWAVMAAGDSVVGRSGFPGWAWGIVGAVGALATISILAVSGRKLAKRYGARQSII